jgi:serine/threonine-protein kinase TTK/MPS1
MMMEKLWSIRSEIIFLIFHVYLKKLKRVEQVRGSRSSTSQNVTERPQPQSSSQIVPEKSHSQSSSQNAIESNSSSPNSTETMNPVTVPETARSEIVVVRSETIPSMLSSFKEIQVNRRPYLQLDGVLGKGASSSVCRVIALTPSTSEDGKNSSSVEIFAFKRILIREDSDDVFDSYANEINLLKSCVGSPYIIQLIDSEVNRKDMHVSMVLELGEVDLATAINNAKKLSAKVNPFFMRMVWERMLLAVDYIHERRIVHGDLKPANFVFVKGQLKLIDFGISKEMSNDTTNIVRNGLIGTINYMAPEAIMPLTVPVEESDEDDDVILNKKQPKVDHIIKHGRASDVWSLGCILYQMLYGKTPFASVRNIQQKVAMITNPNAEIQYPSVEECLAVDVVKRCLVREIRQRATIKGENGLLSHPFLKPDYKEKNTCDQSTNTDPLTPSVPVRKTSHVPQTVVEPPSTPIIIPVVEIPKIGLSSLRPGHSRQPLHRLPLNLEKEERHQLSEQNVRNATTTLDPQDFKNGRLKLRESVTSSSSKWMKPKGSSPEKKDLQSILEKQLGVMR